MAAVVGSLIALIGILSIFILCIGLLSRLFGGLENLIAYGVVLPLGLVAVGGLFKLLADSVKTVELESQGVEPEEAPVDPKKERLKLERLKARLEGHMAAGSVKEELEHRKANPPPPVVPTPYKGGGTLPGGGNQPMYGSGGE
jgi:hypothetical protein